jgi:hypothetical protein
MRLTCRSGKQGDFAISTRAWYMFYTIQEIWVLRDNSDKFRFEIVLTALTTRYAAPILVLLVTILEPCGTQIGTLCLPKAHQDSWHSCPHILSANGLTGTLYGPVSSHWHDTTVVEMSDVEPFLNQIQQNQPLVYSFYGDSALRTPYAWIKIQHEVALNAPLMARQLNKNWVTKKARESNEWLYGTVKNMLAIKEESVHVGEEWTRKCNVTNSRDALACQLPCLFAWI